LSRKPITGAGSKLILSMMTEKDIVRKISMATAGPVEYYKMKAGDEGLETLSRLNMLELGDRIDVAAVKKSVLEHLHARRALRLLRRVQMPWYRVAPPRQRRGRRLAAAKAAGAPAPKAAAAPAPKAAGAPAPKAAPVPVPKAPVPAPPGIPPPGPGGEDSASQTSTSTSDPSGDDGDRKARRYFHFLKEIDEGKKRRRALRRRRNSSDSSGSGATQSSDAKKPGPGGAPKAAAKARAGHVGHDEIVTWDLPHSMGRIKFEKHRERFGAHCPSGALISSTGSMSRVRMAPGLVGLIGLRGSTRPDCSALGCSVPMSSPTSKLTTPKRRF